METTIATHSPSRMRSRHVLRWVAAGIVVLIVVAVGTAGALAATYNPLVEGSYGGTPNLSTPFNDVTETAFGTSTRVVDYVQRAALDIDFSIRNDGPWGITIVSVPEADYGLFHVTSVSRGVRGRCCVEVEPFAPFALGPGEERGLRLHGFMSGCVDWAPDSGTAWNSYRVGYRILGMDRTTSVDTTHAIEVRVPAGYICTE